VTGKGMSKVVKMEVSYSGLFASCVKAPRNILKRFSCGSIKEDIGNINPSGQALENRFQQVSLIEKSRRSPLVKGYTRIGQLARK